MQIRNLIFERELHNKQKLHLQDKLSDEMMKKLDQMFQGFLAFKLLSGPHMHT